MKSGLTYSTRFDLMKRFLMPGLLVLAFAQLAPGQISSTYYAPNPFISPPALLPNIDAVNFFNAGMFEVTVPTEQLSPNQLHSFSTRDTLNYTNRGVMTGNPGFDFEYFPTVFSPPVPGVPFNSMSANFVNQGNGFGGGVINCTGKSTNVFLAWLFNGFLPPAYTVGNADLIVSATNIINSGSINMNASSRLKLTGKNIKLNGGALRQATPMDIFVVSNGVPLNLFISSPTFDEGSFYYYTGIVDGYWGTGLDFLLNPSVMNNFPAATSQGLLNGPVIATTRAMQTIDPRLTLDPVQAFVSTRPVFGLGSATSVVFIRNTNAALSSSVYFDPSFSVFGRSSVQWQWTNIDFQTGALSTNYVSMIDDYVNISNLLNLNLVFGTNFTGTFVHGNVGGKFTYQPFNFSFAQAPYGGAASPAGEVASPLGIFSDNPLIFPQYSAYQAIFSASAQVPGTEIHSDVTNMPGRIEIQADASLDLADSRITALSYLLLKATNHFAGSSRAFIQSPNLDVLLRSTNGTLTITNLVVPFMPQPDGSVKCYSLTWQENFPFTTNWYHVTFVDTQFAPVTAPKIQTLSLTATNLGSTSGSDAIIISDRLNVTKHLLLNTRELTIATNNADGFASAGQINILDPNISWSVSTPRLQYLTNYGTISAPNIMNFAGGMSGPYSNPNAATAYQSFVNHGKVINQGSFIVAKHFENEGLFECHDTGNFTLLAGCALLNNGTISAPGGAGDVSISANSLDVSNTTFTVGGRFSISASNCFSDGFSLFNQFGHVVTTNTLIGSVSNGNFWALSGDFGMLVKPATGDLLATTISNAAAPFANVLTTWAGKDRGCAPTGYVNNLAVGHLILNGGTGSKFSFTGTGPGSALYVDQLELIGSVTNFGAFGLTNINIGSNLRIYYAQAFANGVSIAEKLAGLNAGRFSWVSNYAGVFSSTNITVAFTNYTYNQALVESENIDSDGDTLVNRFDSTPFPLSWVFDAGVSNAPCQCDSVPLIGSGFGSGLGSGHSIGGSDSSLLDFPTHHFPTGAESNLFRLNKRTYHGLFYETNGVARQSAGYFQATLTKSNFLSGNLRLGAATYNVSGRFDSTGHLVKPALTAGKKSLPLSADLQLSLGGDQISGQIISSNWTSVLLANRLATNVTKGQYTFVIPGDDVSNTNNPAGHGFGVVTILANGGLVWHGTLADKTPVSRSSGISDLGVWPLYCTPYAGQAGLLLGWIHFDPSQSETDLSGEALWIKPGGLSGKLFYPAGFTNQTGVVGSAYVKPPVTTSNGAVVLSGGNLSSPITNIFVLKPNLTVANQGANKFHLTLSKNDGMFRGHENTVTAPANWTADFRGVLLQKMGVGAGFFLGTNESGSVWYTPLP